MNKLLCTQCGEDWELHDLAEAPELFEVDGSVIMACPCCEVTAQLPAEVSEALRNAVTVMTVEEALASEDLLRAIMAGGVVA